MNENEGKNHHHFLLSIPNHKIRQNQEIFTHSSLLVNMNNSYETCRLLPRIYDFNTCFAEIIHVAGD